MKKRLIFWLPSVAMLLVVAVALLLPNSAQAAEPSPDGGNHLLVKLTGTNSRSGYQVSINNNQKSYNLRFDSSKGGYYSPRLDGTGVDCLGPEASGLTAFNTFKITVKLNGGIAGSGSYNFCGKGSPYIQTASVGVTQGSPQKPGSVSGCLTYKDEQGDVKSFKRQASGRLEGPKGSSSKTYALQINDDGCIKKIDDLPPGEYKLTADYVDNVTNRHITKTFNLASTQDFNIGKSAKEINGDDSTGSDEKQLDCDMQVENPLSWIICPVIDIMAGVVDTLDNQITKQLSIETDDIFCTSGSKEDTCNAYHKAWESFRNIALGLTAIAGLIVVISQALGFEILDAYTIRKVLPRLLVAVVAITLSWPLMKLAIQFTNDLAFGIRHLIYAPFSQLSSSVDLDIVSNDGFNAAFGTASAVVLGGSAIVGSVIFIGVILSYAATAALAVFIAILVLVLRQVLIIMLLLMAPVAIITYIFPNTQRMYKLWWESFIKALLMFPLIAAFIATGRVFSAIALNNGGLFNQMVGFAAYFAPYFLIPATFKLAGGALRQIGGFVNDRSRGGFDRLRKQRANQMKQIGQDMRSGEATRILGPAKPNSLRRRVNTGLQKTAHVGAAGLRPSMWRENIAQSIAGLDARGASKDLINDASFASIRGNDTLSEALADNDFDLEKARRALAAQPGIGQAKADQMISAYNVANRELRKKGYSDRSIQTATVMSGLTASTAYTGAENFDANGDYIGAGRLAGHLARLSGGDANLQAQFTAAAMEATQERPELAPSFTEMFTGIQAIDDASSQGPAARKKAIEDVSTTLRDTAVRKKGINLLFGNGHTSRHMAKEYEKKINEKYAQHVQAQSPARPMTKTDAEAAAKAEDEWMQMVAEMVATQNNAANLSLEKRTVVGSLIAHALGPDVTVQSESNRYRTDEQFQKYVSDFSYLQRQAIAADGGSGGKAAQAAGAAAQAAAQAAQAAAQGNQPPPAQPPAPSPP